MKIEIDLGPRKLGLRIALVRKAASAVLGDLDLADAALSVSFVGQDRIRELNRQWLGKDRATNVLSFSMREGQAGPNAEMLGDVVIGEDWAMDRASKTGTVPADEALYLLIHGILHLAGYDHEKGKDGRKMRALQERLFGKYKGCLTP